MSEQVIDRTSVTRGHGALEAQLARLRARKANSLIPEEARTGRILDVGCGTFPYFLINTRFAERYGIDQGRPADVDGLGVDVRQHNVATESNLPFGDGFFSVVTMLAVFEHLHRPVLERLLREIHRVLHDGGSVVLTTPAPWTEGILRSMARVGLVSGEEIIEHKELHSRASITSLLRGAGFGAGSIRSGTFELGANLWARADKR